MHLTLPFPATLDDLDTFIAAARTIGGTDLEVHVDGEPLGHDAPDDSTALVVIVPSGAQVVAVAPVVEPPRSEKPKATKPKAERPPTILAPVKGVQAGGCGHAILTAVAERGGTYNGPLSDLGREHGTGKAAAGVAALSAASRAPIFSTPQPERRNP